MSLSVVVWFPRASSQVKACTDDLESKLASQGQAQGQVTQCEQFLQAVQGEIKKAMRPIGFEAKDAELVQAVFQVDLKFVSLSRDVVENVQIQSVFPLP